MACYFIFQDAPACLYRLKLWVIRRRANYFMAMLTSYYINGITWLGSNLSQNLDKLYFQTIIFAGYLIRFKPSANLVL